MCGGSAHTACVYSHPQHVQDKLDQGGNVTVLQPCSACEAGQEQALSDLTVAQSISRAKSAGVLAEGSSQSCHGFSGTTCTPPDYLFHTHTPYTLKVTGV